MILLKQNDSLTLTSTVTGIAYVIVYEATGAAQNTHLFQTNIGTITSLVTQTAILTATNNFPHIEYISVRNTDVAAQTITVSVLSDTTYTTELRCLLDPSDTLFYESGRGWYVITANGSEKVLVAAGFAMTLSGNTSGTLTLINSGTLTLAGGNNITLSQVGNAITISGGSFAAINVSAGTTSNNVTRLVFSNSNLMTFGLNGSTITGQHALNFSAGTTSNIVSSQLIFSNSNNVTFGLNGSTLTASATVASSQGSINFSGGTTSNNLSAITFSNSNNVTFGLNGSTMTASATVASSQGSFNFSAGTTSNLLSAITFSNSNGVTFGLNASTVTASHAINVSGGTTSNLLSAITFSNSNGVSFGLNASVLTASASAVTLSFMEYPQGQLNALNQIAIGSVIMQPLVLPAALSASVADLFASVSLTTSAANNTSYSGSFTFSVGLYSLNAGTLSLASSGSQSYSYSYTSNGSTSNLSGVRKFTVPINVNATPGNWWYGINHSFAAGSGSITLSIVGAVNTPIGNFSGLWGASVNSSNQFVPYAGIYSATSAALPTAMSVSEIYAGAGGTQNAARPNYIIFRNISTAV